MTIKVHGHPLSPPTKRVLLTLTEKNIDYEFVLVDLSTGQYKKEPFISINPFGQVPAFEDDELELYVCDIIITKYVSYAYAGKGVPLLVTDPKKLGIIELWLKVEANKFDDPAYKLNFEIVVKPIMGLTTDEALVEESKAQLATVLDVYEKRLSESKYLGGDEYSLVDLHHVPLVFNLNDTKVKDLFDDRPQVSAWRDAILARPAWKKVLDGL